MFIVLWMQGRVKGTHNKFKPIQDDPDEIEHVEDVLIVRIEEPLFFANTGKGPAKVIRPVPVA